MRVLVTGATGFIGRALVPVLQRDGHAVIAWACSEARARSRLGADVEIANAAGGPAALRSAVERADAIVNLAGCASERAIRRGGRSGRALTGTSCPA